tara:strand:- start:13882 stop:14019 length:138 start_codon:yes stop_codon:yes gene_type:complete
MQPLFDGVVLSILKEGNEYENDLLMEVNKKIRELQKKLKGFNNQD